MTNNHSFETYWAKREESLDEVLTDPGLKMQLKFEAKKAWNFCNNSCQEDILESNVIINKGIWEMITEHNKKNRNNNGSEIQNSFKN